RIVEELKLNVVLTGAERERLEQICGRMRRPSVNMGGETTLKDLARLYQRSSLLVTTDSGPMHVAAAMGTPVVALFGPTDPSRTGPYGEGHVVIRKQLACSPCFLKKCDSVRCMTDIAVHEVFNAVKNKLSR
ncbi:MAG TPA: glycosyltransferase family 9 protein, partial [Syntrophales bacterium]|nr:glycosyltransferase family 9 protein [Syntrophales bacterium]